MTYYDGWIEEPTQSELEGLEQPPREVESFERSPFFLEGYNAYLAVRDGVANGAFRGFQVDWGSYAAFMKRQEIEALLVQTHGASGVYEARAPSHLADKMRALREFVARLPEDRWFKVVVEEF